MDISNEATNGGNEGYKDREKDKKGKKNKEYIEPIKQC